MKKYLPLVFGLLVVIALLAVAGGSAWAVNFAPAAKPLSYSPLLSASQPGAARQSAISISANGQYNIGGVCLVTVNFNDPNGDKKMRIEADAEVPVADSSKVAFAGPGELFFPGCHLVQYKNDQAVGSLSGEDATTRVCFGANPKFDETIYYYLDAPEGGSPSWAALPSLPEDNGNLICADAPYSGVFMPGGALKANPEPQQPGQSPLFPDGVGGTVNPPSSSVTVNASGSYPVGGVCLFNANYKADGLSDKVSVSYPVQDTKTVPFPQSDGLLYLPGCQIAHFVGGEAKPEVNKDSVQGEWEICFAAVPGKQMSIYYYPEDPAVTSPTWTELTSTTANGLVCAPKANVSGIYAPYAK